MQSISVQELKSKYANDESINLIDVRTPVEAREMHIAFSKLYPLDALQPEQVKEELDLNEEQTLYIICQSGTRSKQACKQFENAGIMNICFVEGGTKAWDEAGYELIRGKKGISLERQVRIAAGFLVVLGISLGFGIHWSFYGISAFVGCGLMFAGITDTCGMAIMLAKMPWNKIKA